MTLGVVDGLGVLAPPAHVAFDVVGEALFAAGHGQLPSAGTIPRWTVVAAACGVILAHSPVTHTVKHPTPWVFAG